jgi:hypothetical protein
VSDDVRALKNEDGMTIKRSFPEEGGRVVLNGRECDVIPVAQKRLCYDCGCAVELRWNYCAMCGYHLAAGKP